MKRKLALILAAVIAMSALASCTGSDGGAGGTATTSGGASTTSGNASTTQASEPTSPQILNYYMGAEPKTADPATGGDSYSGTIINETMEPLTRMKPRDNGTYEFIPAGAKSWDVSDDGTVWTFHLNDNKWSDGVPVVAEDYAYGLRRIADPATGSTLSYMLNGVLNFDSITTGNMSADQLGVRAVDDKTLEVTLEAPIPYFLQITAKRPYCPQRKDLVEKYGEQYGTDTDYAIANGPFKIESWIHNNQIVLVKNDQYWDADSVKLEKVVLNIMSERTTYLNAFDNGELDIVVAPTVEWVDKFNAKSNTDYYQVLTATVRYMFFNTEDPVMKNVNIRKAIALSVNRDELIEMCYKGAAVPNYSWLVQTISVGDLNYQGTVGGVMQRIADESPSPQELLKKGMEELGLGNDPAALDITLYLGATDTATQTLGAYVQQAYKESLGLNIKIEFAEWGIFYADAQLGKFQFGLIGWGAFYNEPYDMLSIAMSDSNALMTNWKSSEFDRLITEAMHEMDDQKRIELYAQAEYLMMNDAIAVPFACGVSNYFAYDHVKNYQPSTFGNLGFKYVYIDGK